MKVLAMIVVVVAGFGIAFDVVKPVLASVKKVETTLEIGKK